MYVYYVFVCISLSGDLYSSLVGRVVQCICPLTGDLCSSIVGRVVQCIMTGDLCLSLVGRVLRRIKAWDMQFLSQKYGVT